MTIDTPLCKQKANSCLSDVVLQMNASCTVDSGTVQTSLFSLLNWIFRRDCHQSDWGVFLSILAVSHVGRTAACRASTNRGFLLRVFSRCFGLEYYFKAKLQSLGFLRHQVSEISLTVSFSSLRCQENRFICTRLRNVDNLGLKNHLLPQDQNDRHCFYCLISFHVFFLRRNEYKMDIKGDKF